MNNSIYIESFKLLQVRSLDEIRFLNNLNGIAKKSFKTSDVFLLITQTVCYSCVPHSWICQTLSTSLGSFNKIRSRLLLFFQEKEGADDYGISLLLVLKKELVIQYPLQTNTRLTFYCSETRRKSHREYNYSFMVFRIKNMVVIVKRPK